MRFLCISSYVILVQTGDDIISSCRQRFPALTGSFDCCVSPIFIQFFMMKEVSSTRIVSTIPN